MQMANLDIHNFAREYERAQDRVRESTISERNKELIFSYRDACLLHQVCGKVRLIRVFIILPLLARRLGKDFDHATKEDLQRLVASLLELPLKPTTIGTYKSVLKRFMGFVFKPEEFPNLANTPPAIAWLRSHVRKRDQPRLQRHDLLTADDVEKLLRAAESPRDRALIATLWESGSRISETGNLQVKHVGHHEFGYTLDLSGKTGHRNILVVSAAPYLAQWLSIHPRANDPDSPLWLCGDHTKPRHVAYAGLRAILKRTLHHAGITKRLYPHLFRHSRPTYLLAMGIMNEQQAKAYFGWTPDSNMLATYCHLIDQDANDAILRENNLTQIQARPAQLQPRACPRCKELNTPSNTYCTRCAGILDMATVYQATAGQQDTNAIVLRLVELLTRKGLLNEAADAVHAAGLAPALQALATPVTTTGPPSP
jgi:integrase/recombinase XerD